MLLIFFSKVALAVIVRRLPITSQRLGDRRGIHKGLDESGSGCSTLKCRTRHDPACAKPPVICRHFYFFYFDFFLNFTIFNKSANCSCLLILIIIGSNLPIGLARQKSSLICSVMSNSAISARCLSKKKNPA